MSLRKKISTRINGEPGSPKWFQKHGSRIFTTLTEDERAAYTAMSLGNADGSGSGLSTVTSIALFEMERLAMLEYMRTNGYTLAEMEAAENLHRDTSDLA
jgi:hypothetical protein